MKTVKNEISDCFAKLRKYGYKVYNFNSQKKLIKGIKGFSDYMIIDKGKLYFCEVKIGKDKFSEEQIEFKTEILMSAALNPFVFYVTVNENNYKDFYTDLLQGNLRNLKTKY